MNIIQKYARATNSSNLIEDELHHQTDTLRAFALTKEHASLLLRIKYCGEQGNILEVMAWWRGKVLKRAINHGWIEVAEEVAEISMWFWLDSICHICKGRSHPVIENTPILAILVCPSCNGTGHRELECDAEIKDLVKDSVESLERIVREAAVRASKKLR